jgi:transposase-like protein
MKKRMRRCDPQKRAYWEEVVRRWQESGQSVRGYCRAEGLRESAFFFWRRKLERRGQPSEAKGPPRLPPPLASAVPALKRRSSSPRGVPAFLPVRVTSGGPAEAPRGVEIVLTNGRLVRVGAGFDRQTLAEVLAVLEVRPC